MWANNTIHNFDCDTQTASTEAATSLRSQSGTYGSSTASPHDHITGEELTSRGLFSSRRISKIDDSAIPLEPERDRSSRERLSGRLSCANLRFENLGVVGREDEVSALREAFNRARRGRKRVGDNDNNDDDHKIGSSKELVLISGVSGQGKSRLATTLQERVEKSGALFVQGKYDLYFRDEPYFGVSQACGEICGHILGLKTDHKRGGVEKFARICELLKDEIGEDFPLLANVVPPIVEIVEEYNDRAFEIVRECNIRIASLEGCGGDSGGKTTEAVNLEQSREQFSFLFRKFIRIVTSYPSIFGMPLVMVLDDLQWADMASLKLMESLLTDRESSGLMIIGCYRSEEVDESHTLSKTICDLKESTSQDDHELLTISEISLDQLSPMHVNNVLMELLSMDNSNKTMPLAELCHKRSMGNPLHLMTFLRMLQEEQFLEFNLGTFKWMFDIEKIEKKTSATTNVVDIVTASLQQAPLALQNVLHVAACLGSSFDTETLFLVWSEMSDKEETRSQLDDYLQEAVEGHILEVEGKCTRYRWVHDKVQEAVMILGETHSIDLQFQVGLLLLEKFQQNDLDLSIVFVIANLLMCGSSVDLESIGKKKREEMVKINLEAAKKAVACSAFKSAAKYVKSALALVGDDDDAGFAENYDLMVELYSLGAEVEGCIGNDDGINAYCDKVFLHATEPLHKMRCYQAQLLRLGSSKRPKMASDLCLHILDELGSCKIPRNSVAQVCKALMGLNKVKDVEQETLHGLPIMKDPTLLATMSLLNSLTMYANLSGNPFLVMLATTKMYQKTLKYGLCPLASSAFTTLACVRVATGNFKGGKRFCDHAISLLPIFENKAEISRTNFISFFMVNVWTMPFQSCFKPLQAGYEVGLQCGHTENACWNIMCYISNRGFAGANLNSVVADIRTYLPQMQDLHREEQSLQIRIFYQACLCFMGLAENPTEMSGMAIADAEEFEKLLQSFESKLALAIYKVHQSWLCSVFGEHERGSKLASERGNSFFKTSTGAPPAMLDTFHRGISLFEMARRTRKSKYKRAAKKTLSILKKWAKSGNPNVVHTSEILEAELYALKGDKEKACKAYETSITSSVRRGMIQDAAMANERYGEYILNEIKDESNAMHYLEKSLNLYEDWGAMAKCEQLNNKYPALAVVPENIVCE